MVSDGFKEVNSDGYPLDFQNNARIRDCVLKLAFNYPFPSLSTKIVQLIDYTKTSITSSIGHTSTETCLWMDARLVECVLQGI